MEQESGRAYVDFWRQFAERGDERGEPLLRKDLLDAMSADERAQAALHLVARLRRAPRADRRIVQAIGLLKAAQAAPLLEALAAERTPIGADALLALWQMDGREDRVASLIEALRPTVAGRVRRWLAGTDGVRVAAAVALGAVDTPAARAALARAARDPDPSVSFHARVSLRRLRGERTIQASVAEADDLI